MHAARAACRTAGAPGTRGVELAPPHSSSSSKKRYTNPLAKVVGVTIARLCEVVTLCLAYNLGYNIRKMIRFRDGTLHHAVLYAVCAFHVRGKTYCQIGTKRMLSLHGCLSLLSLLDRLGSPVLPNVQLAWAGDLHEEGHI